MGYCVYNFEEKSLKFAAVFKRVDVVAQVLQQGF